jgi:UDP-N-acetylmuramoyl-tripeptide--D-alanyl-D-alanine ligase
MNALAAAACAMAAGAEPGHVAAGLSALMPVKGRLQRKAGRRGSVILDDTYNANPASLRVALDVLAARPGRRWLVLGDMGELGPSAAALHREAGEAAREAGVERLFTLGRLTAHAGAGFGAGAAHFDSPEEIVAAVARDLGPDVTVLIKGSRAMAMERVVAGLVEES